MHENLETTLHDGHDYLEAIFLHLKFATQFTELKHNRVLNEAKRKSKNVENFLISPRKTSSANHHRIINILFRA